MDTLPSQSKKWYNRGMIHISSQAYQIQRFLDKESQRDNAVKQVRCNLFFVAAHIARKKPPPPSELSAAFGAVAGAAAGLGLQIEAKELATLTHQVLLALTQHASNDDMDYIDSIKSMIG